MGATRIVAGGAVTWGLLWKVLDHVTRLLAAAGSSSALPQEAGEEESLAQAERRLILARLEALGWRQQQTADSLGIDRKTLYRKIRRYGLEPD